MTFQSDVCSIHKCKLEDYYKTVLFKCLYPHALLPAKILMKISPRLFLEDFELLRLVSTASNPDEILDIVSNFYYENPPRGIVRGLLKIRLSPERLQKFALEVMKPATRRLL